MEGGLLESGAEEAEYLSGMKEQGARQCGTCRRMSGLAGFYELTTLYLIGRQMLIATHSIRQNNRLAEPIVGRFFIT
jgi:hypothetical protein